VRRKHDVRITPSSINVGTTLDSLLEFNLKPSRAQVFGEELGNVFFLTAYGRNGNELFRQFESS
jgi:hypothetical protein